MSQPKLPPITQQPLEHIDGTPNAEYPIRILKVYLENTRCKWSADPESEIYTLMNQHQDQRAAYLREAIAILSENTERLDAVEMD